MPTPISDICFPYQHWHSYIALCSHAYIYYETFLLFSSAPFFVLLFYTISCCRQFFFFLVATECLFELPTNSTWSEFIWHWKVNLFIGFGTKGFYVSLFFYHFFLSCENWLSTHRFMCEICYCRRETYRLVCACESYA